MPRFFLLLLAACCLAASLPSPILALSLDDREARLDLDCLREAYPGLVEDLEPGDEGALVLRLSDGTRILYDDGARDRTQAQMLEAPSMREAMALPYRPGPADPAAPLPASGDSPGRRRVQAFFQAAYGKDKREVGAALTAIPFAGTSLSFNARHGAAAALQRAGARLARILEEKPELRREVFPAMAGMYWRPVAGTDRLSLHAFGVAVDLAPRRHVYWRWNGNKAEAARQIAAFPPEIVAAFEDNGFIWGGKWAKYDLMHFEYRPELLCKARRLRNGVR